MSGFHLLFPTKSSAEELYRSSFNSGEVHRKREASLAPRPTEAISNPARYLEPTRKASEGFPYRSVVITDREGRRERQATARRTGTTLVKCAAVGGGLGATEFGTPNSCATAEATGHGFRKRNRVTSEPRPPAFRLRLASPGIKLLRCRRPTHPGCHFAARCPLYACHPRPVNGYDSLFARIRIRGRNCTTLSVRPRREAERDAYDRGPQSCRI
jgi:hypothetical protein